MDRANFAELRALMLDGLASDRRAEATARLAREHRQELKRNSAPERHAATPPVVEDDGMWFSRREERVADAEAEHRARRRRADAEVASRERVHASLSRTYGPGVADRWMG